MMPKSTQQLKTLYDTDYNLWVLETVQKLESRVSYFPSTVIADLEQVLDKNWFP